MKASRLWFNWIIIPIELICHGCHTACQEKSREGLIYDKVIAGFILSALVAIEGFGSCIKIRNLPSLIYPQSGASDVWVWFMRARIHAKQNGGRRLFVRSGGSIVDARDYLPASSPAGFLKNLNGSKD
jgi:hypothetical protein